jgi:prefoldin subunit 5
MDKELDERLDRIEAKLDALGQSQLSIGTALGNVMDAVAAIMSAMQDEEEEEAPTLDMSGNAYPRERDQNETL